MTRSGGAQEVVEEMNERTPAEVRIMSSRGLWLDGRWLLDTVADDSVVMVEWERKSLIVLHAIRVGCRV